MSCTSCVGICSCVSVDMPTGPAGDDGWSPILEVVEDDVNLDEDGDSRYVLRIKGWTGGTGPIPSIYVGYYLSPTGPVTTIASATNIRGVKGAPGTNGTDVTPLGYNNDPWEEMTEDDIVVGSGNDLYALFTAGSFVSFGPASAGTASRIRWKILGKTMIMNFHLTYDAQFDTTSSIGVAFRIKIPGGNQAMSVYDTGSAELIVADMDVNNQALVANCTPVVVSGNKNYIQTSYFTVYNPGPDYTGKIQLTGRITFELD